jgi:DNA modification methylase
MPVSQFDTYIKSSKTEPLFLCGNALEILKSFPDNSIDMAMTSPPYWGKREYDNSDAIGLETSYTEYAENLLDIFSQLFRVLKPSGSFWLNIGDAYLKKCLVGIPWRVALRMCDEQGWALRNSIVWNKVKGAPDNSKDKLRNVHEDLFHFVKSKKYYYDVSMARKEPLKAKVRNGAVVSATGVTGVRYKRQLELSTALSDEQKENALSELNGILKQVKSGEIADFRMIIKGRQRTTHSDSTKVSGRAKELETKGFYFLKYHPDGAKMGDVWDIIPEDTQGRKSHFAPYPADLCRTPILTTCPADGIVLDPFCGTGTTMAVAYENGRKSVGIDIAESYIQYAEERIASDEQGQRIIREVYEARRR